ncbi:carbohydrate-binding domain-containing protein [Methylobacterium sp. 17Sr1-1]|uniref:carbohydrate-binding domain-containing protein n=1 Tax=Methylobacterium sp. 17Sr1-1 TaxID=2202826 RepID=UPI001FE11090|nr:carbohydrate-binding domain-containing protein [Methylobacterium sp. 17Sr1-1]
MNTWIGQDAIPIYQAKSTDPMATWSYDSRGTNADWTFGNTSSMNGTFQMRTPTDVQFKTGDGWAIIVSEDGKHYIETWLGSKTGSNSYHANLVVENTVTGDGIADVPGAHEGIRAAGMSLMGGVVQKADLDAGHIDHAVAMAISTTQAGSAKTPYVWPATTADSFSGSYSGSIPLGSLFAIPKDVDLTKIGITTAEGMALAKAYQNYGGYVTDTAGPNTLQLAYLEKGVSQSQVDNLFKDMAAIRSHIELVTNNTAATPAGGGDHSVPSTPTTTTPVTTAPVTTPSTTPVTTPVAAPSTGGTAQPSVSLGSGSDQLLLKISQDAYNGNAQYTISVDGKQIGGVQTAKSLHSAGQSDLISVRGDWGQGDHDVVVKFLNDAWGGTDAKDRNLYVDSASYHGQDVPSAHITLADNGAKHFTFHDYLV